MMKEVTSSTNEKNSKTKNYIFDEGLLKVKQILMFAGVIIGIFLLGFFASWISGRTIEAERDTARQELRRSQLQNHLADSMVNARIGEYERSRASASNFFTELRTEIDRTEESALNARQREAMQPILTQRDEIITLLARSDPAAVIKLTDLYISYVKNMSSDEKQ